MKMWDIGRLSSTYRANLIVDNYDGFLKKGMKVVDIGCGTGIVSKHLEEAFSLQLIGCDLKNNLKINIQFKKMSSHTKLPFMKKAFDIAMFNDILHHCDSLTKKALLKEGMRIAKKIVIFEYKPTLLARVADVLVNVIHYPGIYLPLHLYSIYEWETLFKEIKLHYKIKKVKAGWFYPFSHYVFILKTKMS